MRKNALTHTRNISMNQKITPAKKVKKSLVVIVFGASGGIGAVLTRELYKAGHSVVLCARNKEKLEELAVEFTDRARIHILPADITVDSDIQNVLKKTFNHFGTLDAVVNTAGTWKTLDKNAPLADALALVDKHFRELARSVFSIAHSSQLFFRERSLKGIVVNVSSHAAYRPELEGNLSYGPSKAYARLLMRSYAVALKKEGIRFCDVAPAIVNTPENSSLLSTPKKRALAVQPEVIARWITSHLSDPDIPATKNFLSKKGLVV